MKGEWEIYSYQRLKGKINKQVKIDAKIGKQTLSKDIDLRKIKLVGQTSGEWISLGRFNFKPNTKGEVKITMPYSKFHSYVDGLLFIKRGIRFIKKRFFGIQISFVKCHFFS